MSVGVHQTMFISHFEEAISFIKEGSYSKLFVLCDSNTDRLCLPLLLDDLEEHFNSIKVITISAGESNKTLASAQRIWGELSKQNADRNALLINLGGGMICDLGGFAASTYKRGIDYINFPATLLAMVDASSGGKNGVNFKHFKNQLGTFNPAIKTYIYLVFLKSLSKKEMRNGWGEMYKHGLIQDEKHWNALKEEDPLSQPSKKLIEESIAIKKAIVEEDPKEGGLRKVLNFGHTVGHAIESHCISNGKKVRHGEAIIGGMIAESYLSYKKELLSRSELNEICNHFIKHFKQLPIAETDFNEILRLMKQDKKNSHEEINFSLLNGLGNAVYDQSIKDDLILESLEFYLNRYEVSVKE